MRLLRSTFVLGVLCCGAGAALVQSAAGQSTTVTTLAVTSGGSVVTTVKQGALVTLTATVTVGGSAAVPPGQVEFCEVKAAPLKCTDIRLLGTAQLSGAGTAALKFFPSAGTHIYQAVFLGTHVEAASSSMGTTLLVSPYYPTITTIASSGGPGNYTLTATVTGAGGTTSPTGTISFLDTSNANYLLVLAPLIPNPASYGLTFGYLSPKLLGQGGAIYLTAADFNGDGIPDLAESTNGTNTIAVLLGNGDGTFAFVPNLPNIGFGEGVTVATGDFNGDGKEDIVATVAGNNTPLGQVQVLLGNGDGTFKLWQTLTLNVPGGVAVSDFNGDGVPDLAITNGAFGTVSILLGNGDGSFTLGATPQAGSNPGAIVTGDFNGDGKMDLAVLDQVLSATNGVVTILLGNGDGTFTRLPGTPATGDGPVSIATGDFSSDGVLDLAVANILDGTVTVLIGNGDGTFTPAAVNPAAAGLPNSVRVADFNGDGKADLVVANDSVINGVGVASVFLGNGDGTFAVAMNAPAGSGPYFAVAGDFNEDGLPDIAVANNSINGTLLDVLLSQVGAQSATATVNGISPVGTGTHLTDASYPGDSSFRPSVSSTIGLTAEPVATTLTLTATPASSGYGQLVMLTATITPDIAQNHSATGTVTFQNGGTVLGTIAIAGGVATFNATSLPKGTDSLTAVYSGDTNFLGSTGSATEVVAGIPSATVLTVAPNPAGTGQTVTLTAAVTGAGATPTGTVTFYDGAAVLGTATLDATGHAAFSIAGLALGAHNLTAVYAGDATYASSLSAAVIETIETPGFTISLSSASLTLRTHGTGSDTVTLASLGSFADSLVLSCGNAPAYVTCSFKPNPAALSANGMASVSLSLNTNALIAEERGGSGFSLALLLAPVSLLVLGVRRRVRLRMLLAVVAIPVMLGLGSCGGNVIYPVASTAPGVYTISVMATGTASGLAQAVQLTLTVTP
jgi:hypothetical protein